MALPSTIYRKSISETPTNILASDFRKVNTKRESSFIVEKGRVTSPNPTFNDKEGEKTVKHTDRNYNLYQQLYKKIPVVKNSINNTTNFAMQSGFELEGSDTAVKAVEEWIDKVNFNLHLSDLMTQLQIYGNAYYEITDINHPKFLPTSQMFVIVGIDGEMNGRIKEYRQIIDTDPNNTTSFNLDELVHFKWNVESGLPESGFYGFSDLKSATSVIRKLLNLQEDLGSVLNRHAEPLIHWIVGTQESPGTTSQITSFKGNLGDREKGGDLITSFGVEGKALASDLRLIQPDGILKHLENQLIAAMQVPEIFIRGGETSNKATADVELQAFDRRVKALRKNVNALVEDFIFFKVTGGEKVKIIWNEPNFSTEATKAEMVERLVKSRIPAQVAFKMVGWQGYLDDLEEAGGQEEVMAPMMGKEEPEDKPKEKPKEEDFATQAEWVDEMNKYK